MPRPCNFLGLKQRIGRKGQGGPTLSGSDASWHTFDYATAKCIKVYQDEAAIVVLPGDNFGRLWFQNLSRFCHFQRNVEGGEADQQAG